MSKFKNPTFEIHTDGHSKVIAVSSFAGQTVRGVAKCAPNDTFDLEYGKRLAIARCASKIAEKRAVRAEAKVIEAYDMVNKTLDHLFKMLRYSADAESVAEDAMCNLAEVSCNVIVE